MKAIKDMSIIVTGGGSGIGEATARYFAERGAMVTICGRRADRIMSVAATIGEHCVGIAADVTDAEDRSSLIEAALAHGGGIDVLINNAANMYRAPVESLEQDRLADVFSTNVIGPMMQIGRAHV